jgi:hypothetical protein
MARRQGLVEPRVYLATIVAIVALTVIGLEIYCRSSPRFNAYHQVYVKQVALADPHNAVFGDSHVGQISYLQGALSRRRRPLREPTPTYQLSVTSTSELASTSATSWSRATTFLMMV